MAELLTIFFTISFISGLISLVSMLFYVGIFMLCFWAVLELKHVFNGGKNEKTKWEKLRKN